MLRALISIIWYVGFYSRGKGHSPGRKKVRILWHITSPPGIVDRGSTGQPLGAFQSCPGFTGSVWLLRGPEWSIVHLLCWCRAFGGQARLPFPGLSRVVSSLPALMGHWWSFPGSRQSAEAVRQAETHIYRVHAPLIDNLLASAGKCRSGFRPC